MHLLTYAFRDIRMSKIYKGSCLCQQIQFQVTGFSDQVAHCHCSMCRKFHGAAFGTLVSTTGLKWTSGKELLKEYTAANGTIRTFCGDCGSSLGFRSKDTPPEQIEIAISTFDENIPVKPDANIFLNYKANWYEVTDQLPQFGEGRDT